MTFANLRISTKFLLATVSLVLLTALATGVTTQLKFATDLEDLADSKLMALRESRQAALDQYLSTIRQDLRLMASNDVVRGAMLDFTAAWDALGENPQEALQRLYIQDNPNGSRERDRLINAGDGSDYSNKHGFYHPWFRRFLKERGYHDVFLISPTGDLVYTAAKERDFATNFQTGPWANSNLGEAFQAVAEQPLPGFEAFRDFERYEPSLGAPASFIAAPVFDRNDAYVGVLAFQMPIDRIDQVMNVRAGMGETGESYIVGQDLQMRTDSPFVESSTVLSTRVDTPTVRGALDGQDGVDVISSYRGTKVVSAYGPLAFMGARWAVLAEISYAELLEPVTETTRFMLFAVGAVLTVAVFMGALLSRGLSRPIVEMTEAMRRLAAGDLAVDVPATARRDEIGEMAKAMAVFKENAVKRQQAESELARKQGQLEIALENMPSGIFMIDAEQKFVLINDRHKDLFDLPEEIVPEGGPLAAMTRFQAERGDYGPGDVGELASEITTRLTSGEAAHYQRELTNGRVLDMHTAPTPEGGTVVVAADVTEQRRAEQDIRKTSAQLHAVLDQIPAGVYLTNSELEIEVVNDHLIQLFGFPEGFVKEGTHVAEMIRWLAEQGNYPSETVEEAVANRLAALKSGKLNVSEQTPPTGRSVQLTHRATPEGGVCAVISDITERKNAEEDLRQNQSRLDLALQATDSGVWDYNDETRETTWSPELYRLLGYRPGEIPASEESWSSLLHPEDAKRLDQENKLKLETWKAGGAARSEYRLKHKDGAYIWIEDQATATHDDDGRVVRWTGVMRDITERKEAEAAMRASRELLQSLADNIPEFISFKDLEGRFQFVNKCFEDWVCVSRDDIVGKTVHDIYPEDQAVEFEAQDREAMESQAVLSRERVLSYPDGKARTVISIRFPVRSSTGEILGLGTVNNDISERKETEQVLKKSEANLRVTLAQSPMGVFIVHESDSRIIFTNPRLAEMFGYTEDDLLGKSGAIFHVDPANRECHIAQLEREGFVRDLDCEMIRADGNRLWALVSLFRIEFEGKPSRLCWIYDITERRQIEAESEKRKEQLMEILDNSPVGISIINLDTFERLYTNPRLNELFTGDPKHQVVGKNITDTYVNVEDLEEQKRVNAEKGYHNEAEAKRKRLDGSEWWCLHAWRPLQSWGERAYMCWHYDITENKKAQDRFKALLESAPDATVIVDRDGVIVQTNQQTESLFGYRAEEMFGQGVELLMPERYREEHPTHRRQFFAQASVRPMGMDLELFGQAKDGREFPIEISLSPIEIEGGMLVSAAVRDITERKAAENAIRESEARFRNILESSPAGISITAHGTGERLYSNPRFNEMFSGDSEHSMAEHDVSASFADQAELATIRKTLVENDYTYDAEVLRVQLDGAQIWLLHSWRPIRIRGEDALICWHTDITERKQAEEELRLAKEQAETALADLTKAQEQLVTTEKMASLGQLTAGIAHEIKNPLNFVNNFSETSVELLDELKEALEPVQVQLEEDTRDDVEDIVETLKGDLQKINHHGRRADKIVKSMLLHARGDQTERVLTSVNDLVEEALNLAYHGERARDKGFQASMEQHLDEAAGQADLVPQDINRVLVNMFSNAFYAVRKRAREAGPADFRPAVAVSTRNRGDAVEIRVRDNGTGMPAEVREKLFDPFFTTKPTGEGTGLGLSMSFDIIVQQHGGRIDVDSEPGDFTEFVITLPRHATDGQPETDRGAGA